MLSWGDLKSDGVKEGGSIRWIRSSEVWWCVWGTRKRSFHIFSSCVIYFLSFLLIYNSHSTNAPFKRALFSAFGIFTRLCNHHYIIPEHSHYPKWNLLSSRLCLPIPVSPTRLCQPFICSWLYVFISCTWIHTICCLLRLASAEHVFKVHPRCSLRQHFISLHGWKIFVAWSNPSADGQLGCAFWLLQALLFWAPVYKYVPAWIPAFHSPGCLPSSRIAGTW